MKFFIPQKRKATIRISHCGFLLLRADHARVEVIHFLARRAFHAREVIQRGNEGQSVQQVRILARQFQLERLHDDQLPQESGIRRGSDLREPIRIFILR